MKKVLLIAAVAVFGLSNVNAQEVSFGPKAGVNFATLTGDVEDNDLKVGFHIGGALELMFTEKMGLQAELLYSLQGTKDSYSSTETIGGVTYTEEEETKLNLSYINIPVSFKYYVTNGFSVEAGPQVGILASAKADYEYTERVQGGGFDETYSESGDEDVKDMISSIDFGLNFGLGYKLDNGLNFSARYNLGLTNVLDVDGVDDKWNNGVIQLSAGFMF
ncbi:porin family protein [Xanthomarina sp. F2636L]|uniref:porin family protein n=1 Tax=Xanthomarina sp. F2636L TaxID=2996018 RepID=UPI00225DE245|nr:porin family protein [Xanthomarina sp. F2636L]MCX7550447.1 porin family protein [Xanthomarina sp. F2636L]